MLFDLPLDQLRAYIPPRIEPGDFEPFWASTLAEARAAASAPRFEPFDAGLALVEAADVTFAGYAGQPIKAWLLLPRQRAGRLPCVVEYVGYGGGRGLPHDWLLWSTAGYASLVMDTRGQGSSWLSGDTPDLEPEGSNPQYPGFMTRGVLDPRTYYYRRLYVDALRALETVASHPAVDPDRLAVAGSSQGGGLALAAAGLVALGQRPALSAVLSDVPFLCHFRRATEITDAAPYIELSKYCQVHRHQVERVFATLSYFDGVNFAARSHTPALFSVGLMDEVCPPSTVFAAYNHYAGPKQIRVWPYNHHEGGQSQQSVEKLRFLRDLWAA